MWPSSPPTPPPLSSATSPGVHLPHQPSPSRTGQPSLQPPSACRGLLPAQHDSGSHSQLATLTVEADSLARLGLSIANPGTLPSVSLYHGRLVALRDGAVFLSPSRAADTAYSATTAHEHALLLRPHPPGWSSHLLRLAYEKTKAPALALHRIMHLPQVHSQSHPPGYAGVTCPLCHRPFLDAKSHLHYHCHTPTLPCNSTWRGALFVYPPVLVATAGYPAHLITPFKLRTATAKVFLTIHIPAAPLPGPASQLGFSMLGMWHTASPRGSPPLLPVPDGSALLAKLVTVLSTTHTWLATVLCSTPCHVSAPPPLPTACATSARPPATLPTAQHSHGLAPSSPPPSASKWAGRRCSPSLELRSPGGSPLTLCLPQRPEQHIVPLNATGAPGEWTLLAANPSVFGEVLIGHADPLYVCRLLPNLHVIVALGTPGDPAVWG